MQRRPNKIRTVPESGVALVTLTQGQVTIVDLADVPLVAGVRWWAVFAKNTGTFYAAGKPRLPDGSYRLTHMQKFLLDPPDGMQADHRNRDTLDNRRSNLRIVTRAQNKMNSRRYRNNSSGYVGVYPAHGGKWQASVTINRKNVQIGTYTTAEEAALARDRKAWELYGPDAKLNFPDVRPVVSVEAWSLDATAVSMDTLQAVHQIVHDAARF